MATNTAKKKNLKNNADMSNDTNFFIEDYGTSLMCENEIDCDNRSHPQGNDIDFELITNCRYYLEGIALTPISVFGILGRHQLFWYITYI